MSEALESPRLALWNAWKGPMGELLGPNNVSMDMSSTVAKTPYARITIMGNPVYDSDLENNECATNLSVQCESFTSGQKAMSKVYDIDAASHAVMVGLGFRRNFGPELIENEDTNIKRVVSRYSMVYAGSFLAATE